MEKDNVSLSHSPGKSKVVQGFPSTTLDPAFACAVQVQTMNWDWDKLQEKRKRQGQAPLPPDDEPSSPFSEGPKFVRPQLRAGGGLLFTLGFLAVTALWLASGFFIVNAGEEAVVLRFGKLQRSVKAGPHYHLPYPFEARIVVNTEQVRTVVVGRAADATQSGEEASNMFTGDENIIHIQFRVQYRIDDVEKYLFNMRNTDDVVAAAAEAAMREVVGSARIENIFTEQRRDIQEKAKEALQAIMKDYGNGVLIRDVLLLDVAAPADADVRAAFAAYAGAREEMAKTISEAEAYRNAIVPVATGTAQSLINGAMAYRVQRLQGAQGEAERFSAMAEQYRKHPDATKKRMFLEAMEEMLGSSGLEKIIIGKGVPNTVMPLFMPSAPGASSSGGTTK